MALREYGRKRDFKQTPEPAASRVKRGGARSSKPLLFVVQKHRASHLHYDFRLEMEGVLKSWAVPKGPSLNPAHKRLAMQVEDHPYDYKDFEGTIPKGNYGAGEVIVWDRGVYADRSGGTEKKLRTDLKKGNLKIVLYGKKLKGEFALVRTKRRGGKADEDRNTWLLIKKQDEFATTADVTQDDTSALSRKRLSDSGSIQKRAARTARAPLPLDPPDRSPMLAKLVDAPFNDPEWVFEVKWDGYRTIAEINERGVTLYSRNGVNVTKKYPNVAAALSDIPKSAVIDGELVALDRSGKPSFQLMQDFDARKGRLVYYAFDLLFLDGTDVRDLPLLERKAKLREILPIDETVRYSEHIAEDGVSFFKAAVSQKLEGIIAKKSGAPYRSGTRSGSWLKIKTSERQEAVIVGFTAPRKSRNHLGSLILAVRHERRWRYVGHTGGGLGGMSLKAMHDLLVPIKTDKKVFPEKIPNERSATWVKPKYVCEIKFTEWTAGGQMRHPVFVGLRDDKKPLAVTVEKKQPFEHAAPQSELNITNREKIYFPKEGFRKGDVIDYYDRMAETILPYLEDRPLVLNRHPNGVGRPGFYQKDTADLHLPSFVETVQVHSESNDKDIRYIVCNNRETLLYAANLGCIEMNPWNSRIGSLDRPDYYVIDLDPGTNAFEEVVEVARVTHEVLTRSCEASFCKTSGKTGLHVYVPLGAKYTYDEVRRFAELLVQIVHRRLPELTSLERAPKKRKNKIYLDWLQNRTGQTLAAPYSLRPIDGATVSAPLTWKEVKRGLDPRAFTIETIETRLMQTGDLFAPVLKKGVDLRYAVQCLQDELG